MIHFFGSLDTKVFAVQTVNDFTPPIQLPNLQWLFGDQPKIERTSARFKIMWVLALQ